MPVVLERTGTATLLAVSMAVFGCTSRTVDEPQEAADLGDIHSIMGDDVMAVEGGQAAEGLDEPAPETPVQPSGDGACKTWSDPTVIAPGGKSGAGQDLLGLFVYGTGAIGKDALRIDAEPGVAVELKAGTFFEPKVFADIPPQPLMLAQDVLVAGPGTFLATANCMKHGRPVPSPDTEFYSKPKEASSKVESCQRDCGDDQMCIWNCEELFSVASFQIVDGCDDGFPLAYRFFDKTQCRVWPSTSISFSTTGLGVISSHDVECETDAVICFGGRTEGGGGVELGLGIAGDLDCVDCCTVCGDPAGVSGWTLSCE